MRAGIDVSDPPTVVQPDIPCPPGLVRRRNGVRRNGTVRALIGNLNGNRTVGEQRTAARLERYLQGFADQLRSQAGAVDIEIALDAPIGASEEPGDRSGIIEIDRVDRVGNV